MRTAIHWFRRDLRLEDNPALHAAATENDRLICCFIFDPKILKSSDVGAPRVAFLLESLRILKDQLKTDAVEFVIKKGAVLEQLQALFREVKATHLYFNRDYEPYARERDDEVTKNAQKSGLEVKSFKDGMIWEPTEVLKPDGTPYNVFTPYRRMWEKRPIAEPLPKPKWPKPAKGEKPHSAPHSDPLPALKELGFNLEIPMIPAGESVAHSLLKQFLKSGAPVYADQRNLPSIEGTSRLSPHLRFGTISPRTIAWEAMALKRAHPASAAGVEVFLSEITWRDFYRMILWQYPYVASSCFKPAFDKIQWENNDTYFKAWCEGRTGYPLVDAAMRQLDSTGWMHNRLRMVVATFLTKDLLVNWQWGERYFMQKLYDGDLASNNGGWQWSASTGTDAQPYFRIFNPSSQAEKFDPAGKFVKSFLPERDSLDYPQPIVEHSVQRDKALALFKKI